MRGIALSDLHCSVARTLDVIGERWTMLILRDAFNGVRRFDDFSRSLPIARNVLAARLRTLVEHGVLTKERYEERPPRYEYRLTDRGRDLYPVLVGMLQWGDRYLAGADGPPVDLRHRDCDAPLESVVVCSGCGERVTPRDATATYHSQPTA